MAGLTERRSAITRTLPGGFKQRLALGCAILHEPPILFLDEPTSGVDPLSRRSFWNLIYAMSRTAYHVSSRPITWTRRTTATGSRLSTGAGSSPKEHLPISRNGRCSGRCSRSRWTGRGGAGGAQQGRVRDGDLRKRAPRHGRERARGGAPDPPVLGEAGIAVRAIQTILPPSKTFS